VGDEGVESSPVELDLAVLGNENLDMTQQCVLTARVYSLAQILPKEKQ